MGGEKCRRNTRAAIFIMCVCIFNKVIVQKISGQAHRAPEPQSFEFFFFPMQMRVPGAD